MDEQPRPCSICFEDHLLLVAIRRQEYPGPLPRLFLERAGEFLDVCAACWHTAGEPMPPPLPAGELFEIEARIRDRMKKRSGPERHLVRSGKS